MATKQRRRTKDRQSAGGMMLGPVEAKAVRDGIKSTTFTRTPKTYRVYPIRFTDEQFEALEKFRKKKGKDSVADVIREALDAYTKGVKR